MDWQYSSHHESALLDEADQPLRWSLLVEPLLAKEGDESLIACFLGKVFAPVEGRNAWHSTWCETRYPFYPTVSSAMRHVPFFGVQGTSRYLIEHPAIVLAGHRNALVLIQPNSISTQCVPFTNCAELSVEKKKHLSDFAAAPLSCTKILCAKKEARPAELPFSRWLTSRDGFSPIRWK